MKPNKDSVDGNLTYNLIQFCISWANCFQSNILLGIMSNRFINGGRGYLAIFSENIYGEI